MGDDQPLERRELLKLAAAAAVLGAQPGCAAPQRGTPSAPTSVADVASRLDPQAADAMLAKLDARMDWIAKASLPDDVLPLSKLTGAVAGAELASTGTLVRKAVRTLYMTGRFLDMPEDMKVHPGVQARLGVMQTEMDDAVMGMTERLERMTPDDHRRVQDFLKKDDLFGERLARVLEKTASDDGLSFQRSFGVRSATLELSQRMAAQSPSLVVDPLVRKVRRIEAHPRSDAEEARRLAARVGEETFWAHQERVALLHEAWNTRLGARTALAAGALATSTYVWPSPAQPPPPSMQTSDDSSIEPAPPPRPPPLTSGQRTMKAGGITMGFGLGSVALGVICAGIATAPALSGFIWPALILGVTIGPILLVVGLIIVIVGAAIRASELTGAVVDDAVIVTGVGAASALGTGIDAHRAALRDGRDGLRRIERFDTSRMTAHLGGTWPGWDGRAQPEPGQDLGLAATAADFPLHELALVAAREAWQCAGLGRVDPRRAALVFGTCFGHGFTEFHAVAERIAAGLDLAGPRITISTACASSTNAIGLACDLLQRGRADVVVAGGADALLREAFAGFSALGVLSAEKCAPFSEPVGTTLGEGAGFVVLERARDGARRGVMPWASVHGYGLSADGFHETTPDPSGAGVARAIRGALLHAGWGPQTVDFVSAHATGTANNDRIEWSVLERELGALGAPPPVSGSKGQLGHTQGAAGALELILALVCQSEGRIPSTLHFRGPRPGCPSDPVASARPRVHAVSRALKLSAAFGGANAVLAYGAPEVAPQRRASRASRVLVRGVGVVGPTGAYAKPTAADLTGRRAVGPCAEVDLGRIGVDPRRLDRSARWLTAASVLALGNGGRPLAGDASARTGLFVGATRMPGESSRRCHEAIRRHGVAGTSASAFARMSVNAPAGACSRALGLLGPTTTVSLGPGSGLLAVVLAAEWLALREDADRMVAGGLDEQRASPDGAEEAEGAACVVLERAAASGDAGAAIVAAGWGIAGPEDVDEAIRQALGDRASVDGVLVDGEPRDVSASTRRLAPGAGLGLVDASVFWGTAEASRSAVLAALAVAHLEAGTARSVLVVAARGASSVALLLERPER